MLALTGRTGCPRILRVIPRRTVRGPLVLRAGCLKDGIGTEKPRRL